MSEETRSASVSSWHRPLLPEASYLSYVLTVLFTGFTGDEKNDWMFGRSADAPLFDLPLEDLCLPAKETVIDDAAPPPEKIHETTIIVLAHVKQVGDLLVGSVCFAQCQNHQCS